VRKYSVFVIVLMFPFLLFGETKKSNVLDILHARMLSDSAGKRIDSLGTAKNMDGACSLSEEAKNEAGILLSCGVLAFQRAVEKEYGKADSLYDRLMVVLRGTDLSESRKKEYVWRIADMLAFAYMETGNYTGALKYYRIALDNYSPAFGDTLYEAYVYNRMGMAHHRAGEYDRAEEYYRKALKVAGKGEMAARIYNNLGMLYYDRINYSKALEYLRKAEKVLKESVGDRAKQLAYVYGNMADVYEAKGDSTKAKEYREKARRIGQR